MKLKSRVQVRKSTKNKILEEFRSLFGEKIEGIKDQKFETASFNDTELILIDDSPFFLKEAINSIPL
ncbi:hypothetical protein [Methanosalsum zhilinae]|uniref:hypothetical protein n=1 Tax=Methanosalsum zhilinae TaxID=39669 RepID=UPI00269C6D49